jgi:hypothetical protein
MRLMIASAPVFMACSAPPGQSVQFEYLISLLGNITQAPAGRYIVFDGRGRKGATEADN